MNDIEKVKRHLSRPIPITIKNQDDVEDVFYFKPLNVEQQAIMIELGKVMNNREKIEVEVEEGGKKVKKEVPDVIKEDTLEFLELIIDVVKNSVDGLNEDLIEDREEKESIIKIRREFCNDNFEQLSSALFKLMPENQDADRLRRIKKKMEVVKDEKSNTEYKG